MNSRKEYNRVPPVKADNYLKLLNKVGNEKAADLLGVGYSTISRYRSLEEVPKSIEKAAELELRKRETGTALVSASTELVVLKVRPEQMDVLKAFLKGMEIKYMRFKE